MFELAKIFDANYYSTMNPDLAAAGLVTPEALYNHFITFGINEGRGFSPYVDIGYYAAVNQDLTAAGLTSNRQLLDHLITYGINEKRIFSPNVDLNFYAAANPDLGAAGLTTGEQLFDHLINFGAKEGRQLVNKPTPEAPPLPELPSLQNFANRMLLGGSSSIAPESQDVNQLVAQGLAVATEQLKDFLADPDFVTKIATTFGEGVDVASVNNLITQLANAQELPKIEILSVEDIGGVPGAFDPLTNTVYVSQQFLLQNANNPQAIADVLLEEIGHFIDARVNVVDAPGDEGQIFAAFVQGKNLSEAEVLELKSENDLLTISPYGQPILVETSDTAWTTDVWNWNWQDKKWNFVGKTTLSKRNDGLNGINVDWGTGSPKGSSDYFIAGMWNRSYFDANKTYKFRVKADDQFYLLTSPDGKNWNHLTKQWEFAYKDDNNYRTFKEYSFTPSTSGYHYVYAYIYEAKGNAYLDLSWDNGWDKNRGGLNYTKGDETLQYMYEEMKNNALSNDVKNIKNLKQSKNPTDVANAFNLWRQKVGDRKEWDHKPKLENKLNLNGLNDYYYPLWGNSDREFYYDIWSNIHFGYVGKAAGFSDVELQAGSFLNDLFKRNLDFQDVKAISLGIQLWNENGGNPNNLTPEKLRQKIISNAWQIRTYNIVNGA